MPVGQSLVKVVPRANVAGTFPLPRYAHARRRCSRYRPQAGTGNGRCRVRETILRENIL